MEWASSIVQAVKIYGEEDALVHLFGKILKNTVDEDFWFAQDALRGAMATMTKTLYRERLQTKLLTDVHKHVEEVLSDRFGLDAWVQARLVERLFSSKNEQQDLKQRLADKLMKKREMLEVIV